MLLKKCPVLCFWSNWKFQLLEPNWSQNVGFQRTEISAETVMLTLLGIYYDLRLLKYPTGKFFIIAFISSSWRIFVHNDGIAMVFFHIVQSSHGQPTSGTASNVTHPPMFRPRVRARRGQATDPPQYCWAGKIEKYIYHLRKNWILCTM